MESCVIPPRLQSVPRPIGLQDFIFYRHIIEKSNERVLALRMNRLLKLLPPMQEHVYGKAVLLAYISRPWSQLYLILGYIAAKCPKVLADHSRLLFQLFPIAILFSAPSVFFLHSFPSFPHVAVHYSSLPFRRQFPGFS